ncbi:hypothetical protein A2U01_0062114, partial [Trifolium medium]|nr:hypothetical protein [Trifolium medium]
PSGDAPDGKVVVRQSSPPIFQIWVFVSVASILWLMLLSEAFFNGGFRCIFVSVSVHSSSLDVRVHTAVWQVDQSVVE